MHTPEIEMNINDIDFADCIYSAWGNNMFYNLFKVGSYRAPSAENGVILCILTNAEETFISSINVLFQYL